GITGADLWQYNMETHSLNLACSNLNDTAQSLEVVVGDLLLFGSHQAAHFALNVFNAQSCEQLMTLPIIEFNQVESIALPTTACAALFQ
ncbi:MAG: hypothetical protein SVR94_09830, partial [Pseudomonadota bacterium]|nr:hypothetical protein [Pseudomonadota bacterium]